MGNNPEPKYFIWSFEHDLWKKPYGSGYTLIIQEAGRYTLEKATQICKDANVHINNRIPILNEAIVPESAFTIPDKNIG